MIAVICIMGPSLLLVWMREKILKNHENMYKSILSYAFSVLFLNWGLMLLLTYIFNNKGDLFLELTRQSRFACKYIALSVVIALIEPYIERFIREKAELDIKIPKINFDFRYWKSVAILYGMILFLLNFIRIFDNNFWSDEAFTASLIINNTMSDIIEETAADVHPPLYYLFVKVGYLLFGNQGWMFHLVSLIPFCIVLIFALTIIWKKFGKETAFIIITLAGISSNAIRYNVEVRMYSWGALFILLTFYSLYLVLSEEKNRNYIYFFISSLAAAYTHYYCLLSVSFFYMVLLFLSLCRKRLELKKVLLISFCAVLAYLPWFITLLKAIFKRTGNYWIENIPTFKASLAYLYSMQFEKAVWIFVGLVLVFVYEVGIIKVEKSKYRKYKCTIFNNNLTISTDMIWTIAGIISIFGTIGFAILISTVLQPFYILRYIYPVSIVAWVILGVTISKVRWKGILTCMLIACMLVKFIPAYCSIYINEKNENAKLQTTLQATIDDIHRGDIILTNHAHIARRIAHYYYPGVNTEKIDLARIPELQSDKSYWLIVSGKQKMDNVYKELRAQGFSWSMVIDDGNLGTHQVWIYRLTHK